MSTRYRIQFPPIETAELGQDETFFYLIEGDRRQRLRFHDYDEIYLRKGLYEQLFYERLKCQSPKVVTALLKQTLDDMWHTFTELRVLDLGAGNGIMGEELKRHGVARLVGADIIPEAMQAAYRDRPEVYDDYHVADFTKLKPEVHEQLDEWRFNCLTSVAALGFGDIPREAFFRGLQFVQKDGWVAFNIKETFLDRSDNTGFSRFVRELIFSEYLDIYHMEKYRHRFSMEGTPLYYFALVAQKVAEIPEDFLERIDAE